MGKKPPPKALRGIDGYAAPFNASEIPRPDVTDPALMDWIQKQLDEVRFVETVPSDGPRGQEIQLTAKQKDQLVPMLEIGLFIAAHGNQNHLETIAEKGRFLYEVEKFLKANKLRVFRAVCSWCGWKKSSAYNWIKLWKAYGERLTDYPDFPERQLLICAPLKDPMVFLDNKRDSVAAADDTELKKMVAQAGAPSPRPRPRGTSKLVIGPFAYTQRKDRATISGLSPRHHQAIQSLLASMSRESAIEGADVSSTLDTSEDITNEKDAENGNDAGPENPAPSAHRVNPVGPLLIPEFPQSLTTRQAGL